MISRALIIFNQDLHNFSKMLFFRHTLRLLVLILPIAFVIQSCDSKRFFEENKSVDNSTWNVNNRIEFKVNIRDINSRYNFYFNIRNKEDYPFSNLYLFLHTTFPNGRITCDTIEGQLADNDGKWRGSGITGIKFNRILFQKGVHLPVTGEYLFEVEQGMRVRDLKGIYDIGLRLEKE